MDQLGTCALCFCPMPHALSPLPSISPSPLPPPQHHAPPPLPCSVPSATLPTSVEKKYEKLAPLHDYDGSP